MSSRPLCVSSFSGCGGSSLGLTQAGFDVRYAIEFIPIARLTYLDNFPETFVDDRDVRAIDPAEILSRLGIEKGELDLFEGSPPCSGFSVIGKREEGWGKEKPYSTGVSQRVDDLFDEWLRLLEGLDPKLFVAENVVGLTQGKAYCYFKKVVGRMRSLGYEVEAKILDLSRLGAAQKRRRLIFVGSRVGPVEWPKAGPRRTLREALEEPTPVAKSNAFVPLHEGGKMRSYWEVCPPGASFSDGDHAVKTAFQHYRLAWGAPANTVIALSQTIWHPDEPRSLSIPELKRVFGFPDDFRIERGSVAQQWERLGRCVPPPMYRALGEGLRRAVS